MAGEYRFVVDKSDLEGKQGILKVGADGYVENVLVGIFNVANSAGYRYIIDQQVMRLLDMSLGISSMSKWLQEGKLIGETGHPVITDFISADMPYEHAEALWVDRHSVLQINNIAMHMSGIAVRPLPDKTDGRTAYGVYAKMRPVTDLLKESLADPDSNTAFSLRSFIDEIISEMELVRQATDIFTFDHVQLNGIPKVCKYNMPGVESFSPEKGVAYTKALAKNLNLNEEERLRMGVGVESAQGIITQVLKVNGKWREVPDLTPTVMLGRQLNGSKIYLG